MSDSADRIRAIRRTLIDAWWRDHGEWVDQQAGLRGFVGGDAMAFRAHVGHFVAAKACTAGQLQALGRPGSIALSHVELDGAAERTAAQRPIETTAGAVCFGPVHLPRTMVERYLSVGLDPNEAPAE